MESGPGGRSQVTSGGALLAEIRAGLNGVRPWPESVGRLVVYTNEREGGPQWCPALVAEVR